MTRFNCSTPNGLGPFEDLSQDMERVFDSLLGRTVGTMLRTGTAEKFVPALDVAESEDAFKVQVDLPGINPEDVKIEMHDGKLSISGTRSGVSEEHSDSYHRAERSSGSFHRIVALPSDVDVDKIDASYQNGVLEVTLPKVAKQQPTKIQIRTEN